MLLFLSCLVFRETKYLLVQSQPSLVPTQSCICPRLHGCRVPRSALPVTSVTPPFISQLIHLVLFLVAASLALAGITAVPGAYASPLTAAENIPSSTTSLLRALTALSLLLAIRKVFFTKVAAAVAEIPSIPKPKAAAAIVFITAVAAGYLLVRRPCPDTDEAIELVDKATRADEKCIPFRQDISSPDFADWTLGRISDRDSKNAPRGGILALYTRLQASLDLGQRQEEFMDFIHRNPPGEDLLARLRATANLNDKEGGIGRMEKLGKHINCEQKHFWPLFPDEERGSLAQMVNRTWKGKQLWETIARLRQDICFHTDCRLIRKTSYTYRNGEAPCRENSKRT